MRIRSNNVSRSACRKREINAKILCFYFKNLGCNPLVRGHTAGFILQIGLPF